VSRNVGWSDKAIGNKKKADDLVDLDLAEFGIDADDEPTVDFASKTKGKKTKPRKKMEKAKEDDLDLDDLETLRISDEILAEKPDTDGLFKDNDGIGIDLSTECPVCRSLDGCDCEEEDRTFLRRVRFEDEVKKVARCPRCQAPLSVLYLPRPGARAPFRLPEFTALWGCSICHGVSLATAAISTGRVRPHS